MKCKVILSVIICVFVFSFSDVFADVPHMINYQGKLTSAEGGCVNDTVQMTFSIYSDSLGTSADWSEMQDEVVVKEGVFSVLLGSVDTIPTAIFDGNTKYLGVQVETDPEMRPLKAMVSTGYAFNSDMLDGMHAGNNVGDVPVNNGMLNTNLNADLLDGFSSEAFLSPMIPINKVVRGCFFVHFSPGGQVTDTFSPEIDPNKSVVVLNDANNIFVVKSLTSSDITFRCWNPSAGPGPIYLEYQIIEYK